jgi:multicomponent Na+:H+ antiporter subunit E
LLKTAVLTVVLAGVWLLWSGHFEPLIVGLGAVSVALVVGIASRMGVIDEEGAPLRLPRRFPVYLVWIFWEIAKANVDVARRILTPSLPIRPQMMHFRATQKRDLGRTVFANSITLTPGTVSITVEGDDIMVHALTDEAREGLESGGMDRMITWLEGRSG